MKRILLATFLAGVTACASQPPTAASVQRDVASRSAIDPIDPLQLAISQALASDKNVIRAYLSQKSTDSSEPVYVLTPIFENEYPQDAINAAYGAFNRIVPGGKLELWLVPKHEYKKYFAKAKPIYLRP